MYSCTSKVNIKPQIINHIVVDDKKANVTPMKRSTGDSPSTSKSEH